MAWMNDAQYGDGVLVAAPSRMLDVGKLCLAALLVLAGIGIGALIFAFRVADAYQRAILVALSLHLGVIIAAVLLIVIGLAFSRHGMVAAMIGVAACGYAGIQSFTLTQDYLSGPAYTIGAVTDRHVDTLSLSDSFTLNGTGISGYVIGVNAIVFERGVTQDMYARVRIGSCVRITYGPHSHLLTALAPCYPAPTF